MDAVKRILMARKYGIDAWLRPAYIELCLRVGSLSEQDLNLLGSKLASQLCLVRERLLLDAMNNQERASSPLAGRKSVRRARQLVEEVVFADETNHLGHL
jgi:hypothetical protein